MLSSVGNSQTDRSSSCCEADGSYRDILLLSPSFFQRANQLFLMYNNPWCLHTTIVSDFKQLLFNNGRFCETVFTFLIMLKHVFWKPASLNSCPFPPLSVIPANLAPCHRTLKWIFSPPGFSSLWPRNTGAIYLLRRTATII